MDVGFWGMFYCRTAVRPYLEERQPSQVPQHVAAALRQQEVVIGAGQPLRARMG